ncbi:MAG TPA: hypothetical protein VKE51_11750 [Vicinamibacterales bacterium]|nr:hypothetical protein [Vicinamibacterales bacterium]
MLYITPWEREALQLLADGSTASELNICLGLRTSETESLLASLFAAMGAATQTQAIAVAQMRGLLREEPIRIAYARRDEPPHVESDPSAATTSS